MNPEIKFTKGTKDMNDVMLDLETLATCHDAVIVQIGLQRFSRSGELGEGINLNVQIGSCMSYGLKVDEGALKFWLGHTPTFLKEPMYLHTALARVGDFLTNKDIIWSHSTFDIPILANAYKAIKQGMPFSYRSTRDIRTLVDLSGIEYKKSENTKDEKSHNALEDCVYQIKYCLECFKKFSHIH